MRGVIKNINKLLVVIFLCFSCVLLNSLLSTHSRGKRIQFMTESEDFLWDIKDHYSGLVVYNRVPKCASTSSRILFSSLLKRNPQRFKLRVESYPKIKQQLGLKAQEKLVHDLAATTPPTLYIRHLYFLDFQKFNQTPPVYINIIRDPVEQFISAYYFNRFGFQGWPEAKIKRWLKEKPPKERFMSIDECVSTNATECVQNNPSRYLSYFCGHEDACSVDSLETYEKAKANVKKNFLVVGIVEDYESTLKLLEYYLPTFFSGLTTLHQDFIENNDLRRTKTARKVDPPNGVKQTIRNALKWRVNFYNFIKIRFYKQLKSIE